MSAIEFFRNFIFICFRSFTSQKCQALILFLILIFFNYQVIPIEQMDRGVTTTNKQWLNYFKN